MKSIAIPIPGENNAYLIDIPETGADNPLSIGDALVIALYKENKYLKKHLTEILQIFYYGNLNENAVTFNNVTDELLKIMKMDIERLVNMA